MKEKNLTQLMKKKALIDARRDAAKTADEKLKAFFAKKAWEKEAAEYWKA